MAYKIMRVEEKAFFIVQQTLVLNYCYSLDYAGGHRSVDTNNKENILWSSSFIHGAEIGNEKCLQLKNV